MREDSVKDDRQLIFAMDAKEKISVKELIKAFPDADVILLEGFKNSGYPKYVCSCPEENADASKIAEVILDMINSK